MAWIGSTAVPAQKREANAATYFATRGTPQHRDRRDVAHLAAAIGVTGDIGGEKRLQIVEVTGPCGGKKCCEQTTSMYFIDRHPALGLDAPARPAQEFASGGFLDIEHIGDSTIGVVEGFRQHESRPLGRREPLQYHEHRGLQCLGVFGAEQRIGAGVHRLGKPWADIGFATRTRGLRGVDR